MIKTTAKKIAAASLSLALLFQATPSFATPTYDEQIETLETKIRQYDNQIIESLARIETLNAEVKEAEARVEETKAEIAKTEESYNRTVELSKERITNIQANGSAQSNFIEVLLTSEGISDFVQKTTALIQIMTSDQELAATLETKQEELESLEASLKADLALIEENKAEAIAKQEEIEKNKATVQTELQNVEASKAAEEEAARQAELARQQAEAATAAAATNNATSTETTTNTTTATNSPSSNSSNSSNSSSSTPTTTTTNKTEVATSTNISASASAIIAEAKKYLGTPYVWGGSTPSGFDCSGFTSYVFKKAGISLPRTSRAQQNVGTQVSLSNVQPGDLVFMGKPAYHVGIYIGGGQWIHAPQTGDVVKIASFNPSKFSSATRVLR
ncbi:C40 family peptidase [Bacillus sp. AGMB 02131]|uniref:C40 family peptidase n=1 Tax=Peribacillus faecalis TaxID=2772559 RepID=A0A927HCG1_9BACI|nr:C40 family peptidase [Peribacillus faecalis]MBD3108398.1 C40 family peptidase [Peribacillus faecalis]